VQVWTERGRRSRTGLSLKQLDELRAAVVELRLIQKDAAIRNEAARTAEIDLVLLDLASLGWIQKQGYGATAISVLESMSELGLLELERRLRQEPEGVAAWLSDEILVTERRVPLEQRIAAATLLSGRYIDSSRAALLRTARTETGDLRDATLDALAGWPDPVVHLFFLESIEQSEWGVGPLVSHIDKVGAALGPMALDRLRQICGRLYVSEDWRDAARARLLVESLDTRRAIPLLIEALAVWDRRRASGNGSKRILYEILDELRRVSGRSIGPVPDRWLLWWQAVLEGRVELPEEIERAGEFVSRPAFFGLRPISDKVMFVVDRSGSMDWKYGTDGRERYAEAVEQLVGFLQQSGPDTRFGIVLFSDDGVRWKSGLVNATDQNLGAARNWLRKQKPNGGTNLYDGVRTALRLDNRGRIKLSRVKVDTVIVLCDGETAEGPDWVLPWLRSENEAAQIVFHCAQIGSGGDGTLQALAAGTGGDFVRFDG